MQQRKITAIHETVVSIFGGTLSTSPTLPRLSAFSLTTLILL